MGGKSTAGSDVAQSMGEGMYNFGKGETKLLHEKNNANLETYLPVADHLSGQLRSNTDYLTNYAQNVTGPNSDISKMAQGLTGYADLSAGGGMDIYQTGLGLGNQVYSQGLNFANGAMGAANNFIGSLGGIGGSITAPEITLGSVQNGTTAAGDNAKAYFDEWSNIYAPAARQLIADAQSYNTAAHREYLASQAAAQAGAQFQNAMAQNNRTLTSMGVRPGAGAYAAMQNQALLANAAQRAAAGQNASWQAEQEGWKRVNDAVNNQAGAHLMGASNDALGVEASVTNANTAAQASVANANTAAQASLANGVLDAQSAMANARMSAAASAFNAGLDAQSANFGTAAQGLMQGYSTGSQGLLQGLNQAQSGYNAAGGLYKDAGQLSIDATRAANDAATNSLGLMMMPREQAFQNYLTAMQPEMWGLTNYYNAFMGGRQIEMGNNANQAGLMGSIIGGLGKIGGSLLGNTALFSDRRLKQDIERVGTYYNGLPQYEFAYKHDPTQRYRGVMADEAEAFMPEAVFTGLDGYQRVDYAKLGIEMETV